MGMTTTAIIPCGSDKLDTAAPAEALYCGSMFRMALAAARDIDDEVRVLILSAKHGLIELDTIIEPYNVKMGDAGSVTAATVAAQAEALGVTWGTETYGLLPRAYYAVADEALRTHDVYLQDIYEADAGIGYQRGTCSTIVRTAA